MKYTEMLYEGRCAKDVVVEADEELSEKEKTISHLSRQFFELDKEYVCLSTKSALDEKKITEISLEALAAQGQAHEHFEETLRLKKQICQMADDAIRLEDEVDELTEQLAASQQRVAELESQNIELQMNLADTEALEIGTGEVLERTRLRVAELESQLRVKEATIGQMANDAQNLTAERDELISTLSELTSTIGLAIDGSIGWDAHKNARKLLLRIKNGCN